MFTPEFTVIVPIYHVWMKTPRTLNQLSIVAFAVDLVSKTTSVADVGREQFARLYASEVLFPVPPFVQVQVIPAIHEATLGHDQVMVIWSKVGVTTGL
jgi:hypothetical protein